MQRNQYENYYGLCQKKKNKKKGSEERRVRWVRWEIDAAITTPKSLKQQ